MFFTPFFLKKKSFFFPFSCTAFKEVLLLALVSEFNCFLRSRCSMEMRCPDDAGRDSWDWVGPPPWGEHDSTPQSGVEAPRQLRRSLLQIVLLFLLFSTRAEESPQVYVHSSLKFIVQEPYGARKMPHCTAKNQPDQNERQLRDLHSFLHSEPSGIFRCTTTGMSTTVSSCNELQLWELDCLLTVCTRELAGRAQQRHRTPCQ